MAAAQVPGAEQIGQGRICVFGAGGVGGYLAARLAEAGRTVSIVARGQHLKAIQDGGLHVSVADRDIHVRLPASDRFGDLGPQDVVIVTTKATDLADAAAEIGPSLPAGGRVIFAVNGVQWFYAAGFAPGGRKPDMARLDPDGRLHRLIGPERSYGMIVRSGNEVVAPGRVLNHTGGHFIVGSAIPGASGVKALCTLLSAPGAEVVAADDLRLEMWRKVIRSAALALVCVPTQCSAGEPFRDPAVRPLTLAIMAEVASVARTQGFANILDIERDADTMARTTGRPSIVQDLERGRPMEIDAQILAVQDLARQFGVATPLMDALAPLVVLRARLAGCYPATSPTSTDHA